jgi:hypothetical protein
MALADSHVRTDSPDAVATPDELLIDTPAIEPAARITVAVRLIDRTISSSEACFARRAPPPHGFTVDIVDEPSANTSLTVTVCPANVASESRMRTKAPGADPRRRC